MSKLTRLIGSKPTPVSRVWGSATFRFGGCGTPVVFIAAVWVGLMKRLLDLTVLSCSETALELYWIPDKTRIALEWHLICHEVGITFREPLRNCTESLFDLK